MAVARVARFDLTGKVALVTRGDNPLSASVGRELEKAGAEVAFQVDSSAVAGSDRPTVEAGGRPRSLQVAGGLRSAADVGRIMSAVTHDLNGLDILVHLVAPPRMDDPPLLTLDPAAWKAGVEVPLTEAYLTAQAAAVQMVRQGYGGRVILIVPEGGLNSRGLISGTLGAATRAMVRAMTLDLRRFDVNVNAIVPGIVEFLPPDGGSPPGEAFDPAILSEIPKGRFALATDIVGIAVFLASEEGDYCTGGTFYVDGGRHLQ